MKTRKGFTLLEMLIVIGIIAILIGVMMMSFSGSSDSARAAQCLNNMRSLSNAVISYGMETKNYPPAATYTYKYISRGRLVTPYRQGWIGYGQGNSPVGTYYTEDDMAQYHAITNGAIWRYIRGGRSSYVCPSHVLASRKTAKVTPAWSYVMNSYFGWQYGNEAAQYSELRIREYDQNLTFYYSSSKESARPPSKTLLFAEMPFVEQDGLQTAKFSTGSGDAFDTALKFDASAESGLDAELSCASKGSSESIGFNHRNGKKGDYMAHVAFADGHVEKIPLRGGASDVKKLTTFLCVGHGYSLTPRGYEKAD